MNRRDLIKSSFGLFGMGMGAKALAGGGVLPRRSDDRWSDRNRQGLTEAELDAMLSVSIGIRVSRRFVESEAPSKWAALDATMQAFIDHIPAFLAEPLASRINLGYKYTVLITQGWHDALRDEAKNRLSDGPHSGGVPPRPTGDAGFAGLSWRGKVDIEAIRDFTSTDGRIYYVTLMREVV